MSLQSILDVVTAALAGNAPVWLVASALVLTTLLLEDVAIAAGVALATHGTISWTLSFSAVAGGIAAGDLGLYALGLAANCVPWLQRRLIAPHAPRARLLLQRRLPAAVLVARVVPGLRLVTYTACGAVRVPLCMFALWVVLAVTLWTAGLYAASVLAGQALADQLGLPLAVAVALPLLALAVLAALLPALRARLTRRQQGPR